MATDDVIDSTTVNGIRDVDNVTYAAVLDGKPWPAIKQPVYAVILLTLAYALVVVLGLVNNTLVVTAVWTQATLRTVTNFFLANLAVADILVCLIVLPITLLDNIYTEWHQGPVLCQIVPYLQGVSVGASVNTLAAVAFERYLAIFHPQARHLTRRRTVALVAFAVWVVPAFIFIPWIRVYRQRTFSIPVNRSSDSGDNSTSERPRVHDYVACHADWPSDRLQRLYTVGVVFVTCYVLPLVCIAFFYVQIGRRVWNRQVGHLDRASRAAVSIRRSKTRLLRMLVTVVVLFAASWLPFYVVQLHVLFDARLSPSRRDLIRRYVLPVVQWLGASNSCVNAFVYCYFSHTFRDAVLRTVRCRTNPVSVADGGGDPAAASNRRRIIDVGGAGKTGANAAASREAIYRSTSTEARRRWWFQWATKSTPAIAVVRPTTTADTDRSVVVHHVRIGHREPSSDSDNINDGAEMLLMKRMTTSVNDISVVKSTVLDPPMRTD